jgi:hypothetical protein
MDNRPVENNTPIFGAQKFIKITKMWTKFQIGLIVILINSLCFSFLNPAHGQTDGTLTFTFTETHSGSSKNVLAVWVTDNSGTFVKTRMRFWGNGTNDHLPSWKSNSGQNTVDAITGPTRTASTNPPAFGEKTVIWDGKDVTATTVPDGTYKVFVETSWNNPEPPNNQHSAIIDFTFEKSPDSTHSEPAGNNYFSDITLDWVPATISNISETNDQNISVYPNPSDGKIQINFEKPFHVSKILVRKINGQIVYQETLNKILSGAISLDLMELSAGIYFIEVLSSDVQNNATSKCIITK